MSDSRSNWTVDASGHYVDWTQPPYTEVGSGIHDLVLAGEVRHKIGDVEFSKRTHEYMLLARRQLKKS